MRQIRKPTNIVSGGQTGVDRAALDVAMELGIPAGGWCPKGRVAEDGVIAERYPLRETPREQYEERTEWNVRDSDATLILTIGTPTGGTANTIRLAAKWRRPCLVVDLDDSEDETVARSWIVEHAVGILNVAGPRASKSPEVYDRAAAFLRRLLG